MWAERVASLGGASILALIIVGVLRGWWVPRWLYDKESRRADSWEELYNRERLYNDELRRKTEVAP